MNYMSTTNIFGWLGGILTLGYNIPQIYKNFKTKSINDISPEFHDITFGFVYFIYLTFVD